MPFFPEKVQKGAKVGGAVGQNQFFCILLNIGSLNFFNILHEVRPLRGIYKLTLNPFLRKILVLQMFAIFVIFD